MPVVDRASRIASSLLLLIDAAPSERELHRLVRRPAS